MHAHTDDSTDAAPALQQEDIEYVVDMLEANGYLTLTRISDTEVTIEATEKLMRKVRAAGITAANVHQHIISIRGNLT